MAEVTQAGEIKVNQMVQQVDKKSTCRIWLRRLINLCTKMIVKETDSKATYISMGDSPKKCMFANSNFSHLLQCWYIFPGKSRGSISNPVTLQTICLFSG
jgi:hypothetical protein